LKVEKKGENFSYMARSQPAKVNTPVGIIHADAPFQLLQDALLKKFTRSRHLKMEETFHG